MGDIVISNDKVRTRREFFVLLQVECDDSLVRFLISYICHSRINIEISCLKGFNDNGYTYPEVTTSQ